jgi:hypothetical protein
MQSIRAAILLVFAISIARAQDPVTTFPKNYAVLLDNSATEVIRVHYERAKNSVSMIIP